MQIYHLESGSMSDSPLPWSSSWLVFHGPVSSIHRTWESPGNYGVIQPYKVGKKTQGWPKFAWLSF